jgi:CRP/FNR family transcriptional regulator, cyclic AMP receptor protein
MADDSMLLIRDYDLWCNLSDKEYQDLNIEHRVMEVPKGEYIYFEAYNHNKIYFVKEGTIKIGYIDQEGRERVKEIIKQGELAGGACWAVQPGAGQSPWGIRAGIPE